MSAVASGKVLPLPEPRRSTRLDHARKAATQVRAQLSLLQGYADLMAGLSPQQNIHILKVMAQKTQELTDILQPFFDSAAAGEGLTIDDYRRARDRNQQLMTEYRLLLKRLKQSVQTTRANSASSS